MIKTIIFDLGKVLVDFDMNKIWKGFVRYTDVPVSKMEGIVYETTDEDVLKYGTSKKKGMAFKLDTGKINSREFYGWMRQKLNLRDINFREFDKVWGDIFTVNKPVCDLVKKLYDNGYGLVALSDTDPIQRRYITSTIPNTMKLFNGKIVTSHDKDVCSMKPAKKNYLAAMARGNAKLKDKIKPEEYAYVDDRSKYVSPAIKLGMNGIWYDFDKDKKAEKLIKDLKKLGVRC